MRFDAVIFDLDGTLVDSERLGQEAGVAAFQKLGVPADFEFMLRLVGKDFKAGQQIVRETFGEIDFEELGRLWSTDFGLRIDQLRAKFGAVEAVQHLHAAGMPVAVATSSGRAGAIEKLDICGLTRFIQTVVARDDVVQAKPHPEPYLTAAARLNVAPEACLAVEDTPTGVTSALAAGMEVLHIPDLLPATDSPAQHLFADLPTAMAALGLQDLKVG